MTFADGRAHDDVGDTLSDLLARAARIDGTRVPTRGPLTHKGRIGDGVERLLLGRRVGASQAADHPAAEIKSVPVLGERVVERCKLGLVSARSNPLIKCARMLFMFVEHRGQDTFVAGHAVLETSPAAWLLRWRAGHLVETAAGVSGEDTRALYLTPRFFYETGLWPR